MPIEIGFLSLAYNAIKDTIKFISRSKSKKSPEKIIAHRKKWKEYFEQHLRWIDNSSQYGEAIIRDVKRVDTYPDIDEKSRGISPWFRVGLIGIYHRGIEVGLRYESLKFDESYDQWRFTNYKEKERKDISALLIGRIPFDWVVEVDWEGDEYYGVPHIYCHFFNKKKEPYEELAFAEKKEGYERPYFIDICSYDEVHKLSKKLKTGYFA